MTSLYIDRRGITLKVDGEALIFYENSERVGTVPLAPLSRVFIRGDVSLSSSLLGKLGERQIGVVILSGRKAEPTMLLGRPHNDAARRVTQYELSQNVSFCREYASSIVLAKLQSQSDFLTERRAVEPQSRYLLTLCLKRLEAAMSACVHDIPIASLRGVEGSGAAAYFEGYSDLLPPRLKFTTRNRRPPKDPVNAALSLGYTLLHAEAVLALYGSGFDPYVGFYHSIDFGRESLACDIVEPLRVEVDRHTLNLFRTEKLRIDDFSLVDGGCWLGKAGRARFYAAWEPAAERLRKGLEYGLTDLTKRVALHVAKNRLISTQASTSTDTFNDAAKCDHTEEDLPN